MFYNKISSICLFALQSASITETGLMIELSLRMMMYWMMMMVREEAAETQRVLDPVVEAV